MKPAQVMNEDVLINQAIFALMDKLGPIETSRFLSLSSKKRMESVKRHQQWQAKLDKDRYFNGIFGKP